jgi:hypothetical protein
MSVSASVDLQVVDVKALSDTSNAACRECESDKDVSASCSEFVPRAFTCNVDSNPDVATPSTQYEYKPILLTGDNIVSARPRSEASSYSSQTRLPVSEMGTLLPTTVNGVDSAAVLLFVVIGD